MAVRFDAVGEELNRTANLPSNTAFTYMMWAVIDANTSGSWEPYVFALDADFTDGFSIGIDRTSQRFSLEVYDGGSPVRTADAASRPALGVPHCIFGRCSGTGTNLFTGGYREAGSNSFVTVSNTMGTVDTVALLYLAGVLGAYWQDGRRWNIKVWDRALSDAEILVESYFERVMYPASLNLYYPLTGASDTADRSGNGRNPTVVGTLTTGDTISSLWRPSQKIFVPFSATLEQSIAFNLDDVTAEIDQTAAHQQELAATLEGVGVAIAQTLSQQQALAVTLDGVTVDVAQTSQHPQALAITLDGVDVEINQSVSAGESQSIAFTLDDVSVAIEQGLSHEQSLAIALDGISVDLEQASEHAQALAATLDGVSVDINQSVAQPEKDQALSIVLDGVGVSINQAGPALAEVTPTYVPGKKKPKERKLMGGPRWQRHELEDLKELVQARPFEEAQAEQAAQAAIAKASKQELAEITSVTDALGLLANHEALEAQALEAAILAEQQALEDAQIMAIIAELL